MKKILIYLTVIGSLFCSSCSDWLEVLPKNEQLTADFWKSKEDVESVLGSGYSYLRTTVPSMISWGELRGGSIYAYNSRQPQKLQDFQITSSDNICSWAAFYKVLNMANSVIKYAPEVQQIDVTYTEASMKSHMTEAYFLRALTYFYLVRNFGEVPLVVAPYVDDSAPFIIAKSSETEIIAQIKNDIRTALESGAAKEFFENESWNATKGRATKWALYALMADVCLWSEDYDECIKYADLLINATATRRPAFMSTSSLWFEIFYPGNSNESIFEINWQKSTFDQTTYSPSNYFVVSTTASYQYTEAMAERLYSESKETTSSGMPSIRAQWGAYIDMEASDAKQYCIWKYTGIGYEDKYATRGSSLDANWIVYRMADIMLMKAEALIWKGQSGYADALDIINEIRNRARLDDLTMTPEDTDELTMLEAVLHERDMELAAEGKRWYDLIRFGRTQNFKYKSKFIEIISENNQTANYNWLNSVLSNPYAWYLPIAKGEMEVNPLLTQNPYYGGTN